MRIIFGILGPAFLTMSLAGMSYAKEWRGVVPLHSKRADVERLLGKASGPCKCTYSLADVNVFITYSSGNSKGGWNVPKDTVLYVSVYPQILPRLANLKIDERKFHIEEDPELPGIFQYENEEEGFTIVVENGLARGFYYSPTAKDKSVFSLPRRAEQRHAPDRRHATCHAPIIVQGGG